MYQLKRTSRSEFIPVRHLTYHVRIWGEARPGVPPLVMVHGWMDVAASYQFVVDALSDAFAEGRQIIAPDWRGYGQTALPGTDNYWFPDYLGDLDGLLDAVLETAGWSGAIDLLGHSMGGNVVMSYAGVRPARIRRLVNLEGFGMPETKPQYAPKRLAQWPTPSTPCRPPPPRRPPYLWPRRRCWLTSPILSGTIRCVWGQTAQCGICSGERPMLRTRPTITSSIICSTRAGRGWLRPTARRLPGGSGAPATWWRAALCCLCPVMSRHP